MPCRYTFRWFFIDSLWLYIDVCLDFGELESGAIVVLLYFVSFVTQIDLDGHDNVRRMKRKVEKCSPDPDAHCAAVSTVPLCKKRMMMNSKFNTLLPVHHTRMTERESDVKGTFWRLFHCHIFQPQHEAKTSIKFKHCSLVVSWNRDYWRILWLFFLFLALSSWRWKFFFARTVKNPSTMSREKIFKYH